MAVSDADRGAVLEAIRQFDEELRAKPEWSNWERRYDYAIENGGQRYPAKQILSMATGTSVSEFSGGEQTNRRLEVLGFEIVRLSKDASMRQSTKSLKSCFEEILELYPQVRGAAPFGIHEGLWSVFERTRASLEATPALSERSSVRVKWSVGQGNWASVPWIALLDGQETDSTMSGVYVVLLFREDMSGVYLTLNQGVTRPMEGQGNRDGLNWLRTNAVRLRKYCDDLPALGFAVDGHIDLKTDTRRGSLYEGSTIAHKLYPKGSVPNDALILADLEGVLHAYDRYLLAEHELIEPEEEAPDMQVSAGSLELERSEGRRVWLISPGKSAEHWEEFYRDGIIAIGWDHLGDLSQYKSSVDIRQILSQEEDSETTRIHDARACFEFANVMKPGDLVLAKKGRTAIVGYGTVVGDYVFDAGRNYFKNTRKVRWEGRGAWAFPGNLVTKAVTDITKYPSHVEHLKKLVGLLQETGPEAAPPTERAPYGLEEAINGLFLSKEEFERLTMLWQHKKNLILQGPPGVGKTFVAKRLAYALMGYKDPSRLGMVQFHQSYSYEDFVQGYRPSGEGFALKNGLFHEFCERARRDQDNRYVFIIDEINRGNLSKIFGELLMLLEGDKRGSEWSIPLTYATSAEVQFYVPENLFLLGLMNTADRSLAVVDYALRRRFAFVTLSPKFRDERFREYHARVGVPSELTDQVIGGMSELNAAIANDTSNLGPGFQIGHSFFTPAPEGGPFDQSWYRRVVQTEILPLLEEYWFEDANRVDEWRKRLLHE